MTRDEGGRLRLGRALRPAVGRRVAGAGRRGVIGRALLLELAVLAVGVTALEGQEAGKKPFPGPGSRIPPAARPAALPSQQDPTLEKRVELGVVGPTVTGDRQVAFRLFNAGGRETAGPFRVEIDVDGQPAETWQVPGLAGHEGVDRVSPSVRLDRCSAATVRVRILPDGSGDGDPTNNERTRQLTPPCADLTARIGKDRMNNNLQYKPRFRVLNQGAAPTLAAQYKIVVGLKGLTGGRSLTECLNKPDGVHWDGCRYYRATVPPLAPGQEVAFNVGGKLPATTTSDVRIALSCASSPEATEPWTGGPGAPGGAQTQGYDYTGCVELDVANNVVSRKLTP